MDDSTPNHDALIAQFCVLTGASPMEAEQYLYTYDWNQSDALAEYFAREDRAERADIAHQLAADHDSESQNPDLATSSDAAHMDRTLDGRPVPYQPSSHNASKKKFGSLADIRRSAHPAQDEGDEDDDDDEDDKPQDFFAGGEKSALAVQNPDDLKRKVLERARRGAPRPGGDDPVLRETHFTGVAHTLGGDDVPSRVIPDTSAASSSRRPVRVMRTLHFWNEGFSIDDGPLYRISEPQNREILDNIRRGRAPLGILNVEPGQEVDLQISEHSHNYVAPKKKWQPFEGQGQRLGAPTPGIISHDTAPSSSIAAASGQQQQQQAPVTGPSIDPNHPTLSLQIRLPDGTRLPARFNTEHTIGDVYDFVSRARTDIATASRQWALMTTFPSKELTDKNARLSELNEFKGGRGGVVVVKWV